MPKLRTAVYVEKQGDIVLLEAGTELPKWASRIVTNPKALVDAADAEAETSAEQPTGYAALTVPELQEELKKRELPVSGTKDELIARLDAADAEAETSKE